jgi:hypothetical protein
MQKILSSSQGLGKVEKQWYASLARGERKNPALEGQDLGGVGLGLGGNIALVAPLNPLEFTAFF